MLKFLSRFIQSYLYGNDPIFLGRRLGPQFYLKDALSKDEMSHHVHVVGASGYGKSVLLSHLIRATIERGQGLLFLDLKSDIETVREVKKIARECNRERDLKIFSLSDVKISSAYNPVQSGSPTQIRDRIVGALNWSEEYYRSLSSSFLLKLLLALCWLRDERGEEVTLKKVLDCATYKQEIELIEGKVPEENSRIRQPIEQLKLFMESKDNLQALAGLRSQLESIVLSDFGELVSQASPEARSASSQEIFDLTDADRALIAAVSPEPRCYPEGGIDLFEAVQRGQIIYFLLDSRRYSETAMSIARFVLADLKATSSRIDSEIPKVDRRSFQVVIDEFADMATEDFVSFLDRARSSRMSVCLAHQELSDLRRVSPEFAARLTGNMSTMYAFLQKNKESAEAIASTAGTREVRKETHQSEGFGFFKRKTGMSSVRMVEEFRIHPNTIKTLRVGECIAIKKYPYSRAYKVRVNPPRG